MVRYVKTFSLRDVLIGKQIIPSRSEYKRLMLTGYLSIICIVVAFVYFFLDLFHDIFYAFPVYALLIFMPLVAVILIRNGRFWLAKVVLMVSANLVVFWSALNDPFETGVFLFFIPTSMGSFAILSTNDKRTGIALVSFTTCLFFVAYFADLQPLDLPRPSEEYIRVSFVLNYFISAMISVLSIFFLMRLNRSSEKELVHKEQLAIEKNAELQKVNDELDRFVYSVSHDLRSPLSSILGLTNVARLAETRDEVDRILEMIRNRVTAQDHFIREIIDFSRNARTEPVPEPVRLKDHVSEIIRSLQFDPNAEKISFINSIPDDAVMMVDRIRLTMILSNLIGNSIKYFDHGKSRPFVEVGYEAEKDCIFVRDNGIGIKDTHQERIFEMFYRASDRSTGSGLGLFITREAVTKLNGEIKVDSSFGEGSTFKIFFRDRQAS